jgi:hypothetical protein
MSLRSLAAFALSCFTLAGCGAGSGLLGTAGNGDAATVRFVNASAATLDVATNGVVIPANAALAPGAGTACFAVADPLAPGLSVRQAGSGTDLSGFVTTFANGGHYTLVAFPGVNGAVQFISLPNTSLPAPDRSELRVLNASSGLGAVDVHVTPVGATLGTPNISGIAFGSATGTFDVAAGTMQVRLTSTGSTNVVFDAGSRLLDAGRSYTLIVSSATAGLLVGDCP